MVHACKIDQILTLLNSATDGLAQAQSESTAWS